MPALFAIYLPCGPETGDDGHIHGVSELCVGRGEQHPSIQRFSGADWYNTSFAMICPNSFSYPIRPASNATEFLYRKWRPSPIVPTGVVQESGCTVNSFAGRRKSRTSYSVSEYTSDT